MPLNSQPHLRIDRYSGPYERWTFTEELGRPFAFPAIANGSSCHYTAVLEGHAQLQSSAEAEVRIAPLWNPLGRKLSVTPFAFTPCDGTSAHDHDTEIARLLGAVLPTGVPESLAARFRVNFPVPPESWATTYDPGAAPLNWIVPPQKPRAIVAVIDDGIPFAHTAFLRADGGTRISHCWLQAARAQAGASPVPFGHELTNGQIDDLRLQAGGDEARAYRMAGAVDPAVPEIGTNMRRITTHGAHVMGLAAGNSWRLGDYPMPDDIAIIAVQLPNTIAWDTSGFGKEMYMLSALHYVFARARAIAAAFSADPQQPQELPLVVNFSYGWSAGRHDGRSAMEAAIEDLLADRQSLQPATALVMPSGNNFGDAMHGQITGQDMSEGSFAFGWKILPDDHTSSYLEIWFPEGFDPDGWTVHIMPPTGTSLSSGDQIAVGADPTLMSGNGQQTDGDPRRFAEIEVGGVPIGQLSADFERSSRWRVMIALAPSVYTRGQSRRAPAGLWRIELRQNGGSALDASQDINVWVQRDDDPSELNSLGRQSRLVDLGPPVPRMPSVQQFDARLDFIRGFGATNAVCSSPRTTRVGGYEHLTGRPVAYAGAQGVRRTGTDAGARWGAALDLCGVASQSPGQPWSTSIGALSGGTSRLVGTSAAAPAVARLMVINAAEGRDLMHGMLPVPPIRGVEPAHPVVAEKYAARMGTAIAPVVIRNPV